MTVISFYTGRPMEPSVPAPGPAAPTPKPKTRPGPARRKRGTEDAETRKAMLAKIHVAKKQLGMTDEEYRGMIDGLYGVDSAGKLDNRQLHGLLLALARVGFTATKGSARRGANRKREIPALIQPGAPCAPERVKDPLGRKPYMDKIEAMLAEKGRVEGTHVPWGYAVAILKRQSGGVTKCLDHATVDQLKAVIAALAYDARRKGRYAGTWGE